MILFVVYAVFIWYVSFRYRRSLAGIGVFFAGLAGIALVGGFHYQLNEWTGGKIYLPVLQILLYPYAGLVAFISAYLWIMPRRPAENHCVSCGYSLRGLELDQPTCPECGVASATIITQAIAPATVSSVSAQPSPDSTVGLNVLPPSQPVVKAKAKVARFIRG